MHPKVSEIIEEIRDHSIKRVVSGVMEKVHDKFIVEPGGCANHHAYEGGLLDHCHSTAMLGAQIADRYIDGQLINRDIVIAGAFLHDIGKTFCYKPGVSSKGKPIYVRTLKNDWHHHIPMGFHMVASITDELVSNRQIEEIDADHILHIIVSHHGRIEYRSPRRPATTEAFIVSQADMIDAFLNAPAWARETYNK